MVQKRHDGEPVPFAPSFAHLALRASGTRSGVEALDGGKTSKRGRPPRQRNAKNMIEQRPSPERRRASAALDEARLRQQAIGVRLRQMFDEVVNEDVPDEFLDILRRADSRSSEKG
jgi:hypothetical protein